MCWWLNWFSHTCVTAVTKSNLFLLCILCLVFSRLLKLAFTCSILPKKQKGNTKWLNWVHFCSLCSPRRSSIIRHVAAGIESSSGSSFLKDWSRSLGQGNARPVFLSTAVAEEGPVLGVGDVMSGMANTCADGAHANPVDHLTGVAVVPVSIIKSYHDNNWEIYVHIRTQYVLFDLYNLSYKLKICCMCHYFLGCLACIIWANII